MSIELLKKLVELVPEQDAAQMVVDLAGLPSDRIDFSGPSKTMWHKVLREAKKHNDGILNILESVIMDYPKDIVLLKLKNEYSQNNTAKVSETKNDSTTLKQIDKTELKTLVAQNKIEKVVKILTGAGDKLDSDLQNQLIIFQARNSELVKGNLIGTIAQSEFNLEMNRLRVSLLSIIDTITI